jgi:hypothetical protein
MLPDARRIDRRIVARPIFAYDVVMDPAHRPSMPSASGLVASRAGAAVAIIWFAYGPAAFGQIFKCVDSAGRTTYQQAPCGPQQRGGKLQVQNDGAADGGEDLETRWRTTAARREVSPGMPKRWVQQALGQPSEIRPGRGEDSASEVWSYSRDDGVTRVGFNAGIVAWSRLDPALGANVNGGEPDALADSNIVVGRECVPVLAGLPAPVNQEGTTISGATIGMDDRPLDAVRYTFENGATRLILACAMNKVADVQRQSLR